MNTELEYQAYLFWKKLSPDERHKFLSENQFWDGFANYLFEYLPEDLKEKLRLKMA